MMRTPHLLKLSLGRYLILDGVSTVVHRDQSLKVWFRGDEGSETFTGADVVIIARRLDALAAISTSETRDALAGIPLPPGSERPEP